MTGRVVNGHIEFVCSACGQTARTADGRYTVGAACGKERRSAVTTVYATGVVRKAIT